MIKSMQTYRGAGALLLLACPSLQAIAADETAGSLEEIVVTANKRTESAQRAPLAVTSVSAADLSAAHVTGVDDLFRVMPNVQVDVGGSTGDPAGSNAQFSIRGLGASATGPQGSSGVAVHFDGVFRQNGLSNGEFYDLQRVEVDPGPQGTLYGRSAAAGAVNVIPNAPAHEFAAEGTVETGNYSEVRVAAMLNVPLNDVLAVRGSFQSLKHDGYFSNGYDNEDTRSGRLQALLTPTADLSIRLYADYTHIGGIGASEVFLGGPGIPQLTALFPELTNSDVRDRSIAQYCAVNGASVDTCVQQVDVTKWSTHIEASYNLGWGVITVLPAFNGQNEHAEHSNAPLPLSYYANEPYNQNQTSVEVRLSDPGTSPLKWVGGFNYFRNHVYDIVNQNINVLVPLATPVGQIPGVVSIESVDEFRASQVSYAAFGQLVYPVADWLRVTAGARYNHDTADYQGDLATNSQKVYILNGPLVATPVPAPIGTGPLSSSVAFNAVTYRLAVDADVAPNSIVYASMGTGYKPGGLNDGGPAISNTPEQLALLGAQFGVTPAELAKLAPSQSFGPEKVTHFEVGSKNRFLDNRLELNDAIYFDDYKNYQNGSTQVVNPLLFQTQGFVITNAGKSRVYGNELSVKYQLTHADLVTASVNYLRAYFTSYVAPANLSANGPAVAQEFSGNVLPNAPLFSANVSYAHVFTLPDGGHLTAGLYTHLTDGYWTYFAESPGTYQSHYSNSTADLTWSSAAGHWSVSIFGKNLENKTVLTLGEAAAGFNGGHLNAPRTYGASISVRAF